MGPTFYLGAHQPSWLADSRVPAGTPLFVSHRRLTRYRRLPKARLPWALDSGGFSELSLYGQWRTSPAAYIAAVRRYDAEVGHLEWAAPQDWMCEPIMLARTGLTIEEHQRRTVASFIQLRDMWGQLHPDDADLETDPDHCPIQPVIQGWQLADYLRCVDMYAAAGIDLRDHPVVGVGSVCRRESTDEIGEIVTALHGLDLALHGFGVKSAGIAKYGHLLASADSMAWSYGARREPPLPGCEGHINCANCLVYALRWRAGVTVR